MIFLKYFSGLICIAYLVSAEESNNLSQSTFRHVRRVYKDCENSDDFYKCLKVNAVKLANRAIKIQNLKLIDGISVIRKEGVEESRSFDDNKINDLDLAKVSSKRIDHLLSDRSNRFMDTHQIEINVPRLFSMGQKQAGIMVEAARKKSNEMKFLGPFLAAVAIKGGILTMAYHSIAIVAGKALIIGKIALIISAIIGLKKLVTPEGHEKTTYEIVKHPQVQQSHTYSTSHNEFDGHEGGGGGGQYHRSLNDEMMMQDRAYRGHVKASV